MMTGGSVSAPVGVEVAGVPTAGVMPALARICLNCSLSTQRSSTQSRFVVKRSAIAVLNVSNAFKTAAKEKSLVAGVEEARSVSSRVTRTSSASCRFASSCTPAKMKVLNLYTSTPLRFAERISTGASSAMSPSRRGAALPSPLYRYSATLMLRIFSVMLRLSSS